MEELELSKSKKEKAIEDRFMSELNYEFERQLSENDAL